MKFSRSPRGLAPGYSYDSPFNSKLALAGLAIEMFTSATGGFYFGGELGPAMFITGEAPTTFGWQTSVVPPTDTIATWGAGAGVRVGFDFQVGPELALGVGGRMLGAVTTGSGTTEQTMVGSLLAHVLWF
jgi:hypothetical protein